MSYNIMRQVKTISDAYQDCLDIVNGNYDAMRNEFPSGHDMGEDYSGPISSITELIARIVTDIQVRGSIAEFWPHE